MEFIKECFRNLSRKKMRSFLTVFGVAIGVLSVVVISTIGEVGTAVIDHELESIGANGLTLQVDTSMTDQLFGQEQIQIVAQDPDVAVSMPVRMDYTETQTHESEDKCAVFGVTQDVDQIVSLHLLYGRLLTQNDVAQGKNVCVVDESFAQLSYSRSNIVGKTVSLKVNNTWENFEVVGVVTSGGNMLQNMLGNYVPSIAYAPISAMQTGDEYQHIMLQLKDEKTSETTASRLVGKLSANMGTVNAVTAENMASQKDQLNNLMNMVTWILSIIAAISLVVAGLSIMTVMLVSVHERTKEIGIKKAIGAKRGRILLEFMAESFILCVLGSLIGLTLGLLVAYLGCLLLQVPFVVNPGMLAFYSIISVAIGVIFGVYPANKAAKLKPVDALSNMN